MEEKEIVEHAGAFATPSSGAVSGVTDIAAVNEALRGQIMELRDVSLMAATRDHGNRELHIKEALYADMRSKHGKFADDPDQLSHISGDVQWRIEMARNAIECSPCAGMAAKVITPEQRMMLDLRVRTPVRDPDEQTDWNPPLLRVAAAVVEGVKAEVGGIVENVKLVCGLQPAIEPADTLVDQRLFPPITETFHMGSDRTDETLAEVRMKLANKRAERMRAEEEALEAELELQTIASSRGSASSVPHRSHPLAVAKAKYMSDARLKSLECQEVPLWPIIDVSADVPPVPPGLSRHVEEIFSSTYDVLDGGGDDGAQVLQVAQSIVDDIRSENVTSVLMLAAKQGDKRLVVSNVGVFKIGAKIYIARGLPGAEVAIVVGYGSLLLENGLSFDHDPGTEISWDGELVQVGPAQSDSDLQMRVLTELIKKNVKPADKATLKPWPTAAQFPAWRRSTRDIFANASHRGDAGWTWIVECEQPGVTYESLANCGDGFEEVDLLLARELKEILKGELGRMIGECQEAAARGGKPMRGRQMLFLIYRDFEPKSGRAETQRLKQLNVLKGSLQDIPSIPTFLNNWDLVINSAPAGAFSEAQLTVAMEEAVENIDDLKPYRVAYSLLDDDDDDDKNHKYFRKGLERLYEKRKNAVQEKGWLDALGAQSPSPAAAGIVDAPPRTQYCYKFSDTGSCAQGDQCDFSHAAEPAAEKKARVERREKRSSSTDSRRNGGGQNRECHFHKKASGCSKGNDCTFKHSGPSGKTGAIAAVVVDGGVAVAIENDLACVAGVSPIAILAGPPKSSDTIILKPDMKPVKVKKWVSFDPDLDEVVQIQMADLKKGLSKVGITSHDLEYTHPIHMQASAENNLEHTRVSIALGKQMARDVGLDTTTNPLHLNGFYSAKPVGAVSCHEPRIIDSGASFNMTSRKRLSPEAGRRIYIGPKLRIMTAKGVVETEEYVNEYLAELDTEITSIVLDDTPNVVSLGQTLKDLGLDLLWRHDGPPILFKGPLVQHVMTVKSNVPYFSADCGEETRAAAWAEILHWHASLVEPVTDLGLCGRDVAESDPAYKDNNLAYNPLYSQQLSADAAAPPHQGSIAADAVAPPHQGSIAADAVAPPRVTLIEFCCSEDSAIGKVAEKFDGVEVHRLSSERGNLNDDEYFEKVLEDVKLIAKDHTVHLWGSVPCTPWSTWQRICVAKNGEKYRVKLEKRKTASRKLIRRFKTLADMVIANGGNVGFEWPRYCDGWNDPEIKNILKDLNLNAIDLDGCQVGVASIDGATAGLPILKPWRMMVSEMFDDGPLENLKCSNEHTHARCEGRDTVDTGFYTIDLAERIVKGLTQKWVENQGIGVPGSETVFFEIEDRDMLADGEIDPTLTAIERQIGQHSLEYALSPEHLAGHLKFCRSCVSCMAGKGQISQARRLKGEDRRPIAEKPGDLLTDFFICGPKSYGTGGEKAGLVVADRYSGKVKSFPTETRSSIFVGESFTDFAGKTPITNLHSDNGEEIIRAAKDLGIVHRTSTPYRHQSNGQAENWVRQVIESTRVSLHRSGFTHRSWPIASIYATAVTSFFKPYSRREGDEPMTPYMREFGVEVNALRIPFGAVCYAQFYSEDDKDRPKFEAKREECLFLGWHRHPGGEWSKDYFVVKLQDYIDHPDKIPMPRRVRDVFQEGSSVRMPAFEAKQ